MSNLDYDQFTVTMNHFDAMREELGMSSVWSMYDGNCMTADQELFTDKSRTVVYEYVRADATTEELMADLRDGKNRCMVQVSSVAVDGTIKSLWAAAESCIKQSGTHHQFIEDFELQDDGTLLLETGS
jgi:hypothetical protein|tara:strand:- start:178 stop:561 length:384 start_codon:yes stop_codon:yes gene_type:complete